MKTERQAHDALTDRREYSPRISLFEHNFDQMEEAGLGVEARDSKLASDFAELSAESNRRTDRLVNWLAVALVLVIVAWVVI